MRDSFDRLIVILGVLAILLGLAVMGRHFQQRAPASFGMCESADSHCGERHI
jgi:hypothetical protein